MPERRIVRVSHGFLEQLDELFGSERGPAGEPSATDFLILDLPPVVERFATAFEDLPEIIVGVPEARMLIGTGRLARAFAVYGVLTTDGSVELVGITVEN